MQEEFEKKVQERMQTFGVYPSPQVWDDIDAVLSKKKHHRVFIGWWILLGLVIAGGGVLLYEKDNLLHDKLNQQPVITGDTVKQNNLAKSTPVTIPAPVQKGPEEKTQPKTEVIQKDIAADRQQISTKNNIQFLQRQPGISKTNNNKSTIQQNEPIQQNKSLVNAGETVNKQPADNQTSITAPAIKEPPTLLPGGGDKQAVAGQPTVAQPKQPVADVAAQKPQPPSKKVEIKTITSAKHQWFFTLSAGVLQTNSHSVFNEDKNLPAANTNITALTSPAALKYDIASPGTGFTITGGVVYEYKLSPGLRVHGGVQAAYLANTQKTGNLYIQSFDLYNGYLTANSSGTSVQSSYYLGGAGNQGEVINKAWQLQVPVGLNYTINPRAKTKFFIDGGFSIAWMLSSHWLIPDTRFAKLYYNKQVLNNTIISWQAGPAVELKDGLRFGLYYQQSFTTLAKTYVTPQLHWQNLNVSAALPFSIKLKKSTAQKRVP